MKKSFFIFGIIFCIVAFLLAYNKTDKAVILLLPDQLSSVAEDYTSLREGLFDLDGVWFITDSNGRDVETYSYKHLGDGFRKNKLGEKHHISSQVILDVKDDQGYILTLSSGNISEKILFKLSELKKYQGHYVLPVKNNYPKISK